MADLPIDFTHYADISRLPEDLRLMLQEQQQTMKKGTRGGGWHNCKYASAANYLKACQMRIVEYYEKRAA